MARQRTDIVDGPGTDELFEALKRRHTGQRVTFALDHHTPRIDQTARFRVGKITLPVIINEIGVEDGSGNRWLLKTLVRGQSVVLDAYYDSRERKGWIEQV